jgi:hypothetical protein
MWKRKRTYFNYSLLLTFFVLIRNRLKGVGWGVGREGLKFPLNA